MKKEQNLQWPRSAIPTARQLEYQEWEMGLFLHFGIRTFYEGHRDFDGQRMDPACFNPVGLDCDQWARVAAAAGMRYMVLTAKHHDGFANWPSRHTDFSVARTPWKNGRGDVVREFVDAGRRHGLALGLYYSPADASCPVYNDPTAYDDYFIRQITELLDGGYGEIDMLWLDGCGSEGHTYDWQRIVGEVRRLQPRVLIFGGGDPDYGWIGNEAGIAPSPNWNSIETGPDGASRWMPAECDFRMRLRNWFYSDRDEDTVKTVQELLGIYYYSVGRGRNFLINIGPDRRGCLPERDAESLLAFGSEIKRRFTQPLMTERDFERNGNTWNCTPAEPGVLCDHVVLQEDLSCGEHVRRFRIRVLPVHYGDPITVFEGYNIGYKAVCRFPLIHVRGILVEILQADGEVLLSSVKTYNAGSYHS